MIDFDLLIASVFGVVTIGYLLFVNRRRQTYTGRFTLDTSIETSWDLLSIRPGFPPPWIPQLVSIDWLDEEAREVLCRYETGQECVIRLQEQAPPTREQVTAFYRWNNRASPGDLIYSRLELQTVPEGTDVKLAYAIERRNLTTGFVQRLSYPFLTTTVSRLVRSYLARERQKARLPEPARGTGAKSSASRPLIQLVLALLSLAAMTAMFGLSTGLAVLATVVVHEYGHVHALRRHGHEARFYLIPFLGGVALGSRSYVSDAEASEVLLMGPAFGLLPPLACLAACGILDSRIWLGASFIALVVNGFNLLPTPPLDGGRIAQILLKPLGDRAWFAASGLLILAGGGVALNLESKVFLILSAVTAILWSASPKRSRIERPLTRGGGFLVMGAYFGLILLHLAAIIFCVMLFDGSELRNL